jgi:hypothetical protein
MSDAKSIKDKGEVELAKGELDMTLGKGEEHDDKGISGNDDEGTKSGRSKSSNDDAGTKSSVDKSSNDDAHTKSGRVKSGNDDAGAKGSMAKSSSNEAGTMGEDGSIAGSAQGGDATPKGDL